MSKIEAPPNWRSVGQSRLIKIGKLIGEGARSHVYQGIFQDRRVAVKSLLYKGNPQEVEILRGLRHGNVIRIHYKDTQDATLYIVLDFCQYTLKEYVEKKDVNQKINLSDVEVLRQVTEGLDYLHNGEKASTVHRDLKPSNILFQFVDRESIWVVKISDFGISKDFVHGKTSTISEMKGSNGFVAPELIPRADGSAGPGRIRKEIDIFSLGIIFYYVFSKGFHPYSDDMTNVNEKVRDIDPNLSSLNEEVANKVTSLILSMLEKDSSKRIKISDVKAHHLFWDDDKKLGFLQKVSDFLENRGKHRGLLEELEIHSDEVFNDNWEEKLVEGKPEVKRVLKKRGQKDYKSLQALMRQIRNWNNHFHDAATTQELREEVGELPSGFLEFFTSRFPKLIPCLYDFMKAWKEEKLWQKYYKPERQESVTCDMMMEISGTISEEPSQENEAAAMKPPVAEMEVDDVLEGALGSSDEDDDFDSAASSEKSPTLVLRPYQRELAQQALAGYNSLIIAPTGSGKTAVANEIIKNHLLKPGSRSIIFLVSKTTLARQQYEFFTKFLSECLNIKEIAYLIGEITSKIAVGAIIKTMRLTILTPQILINEMTRDNPFISFHDISMMIFDECHNATKKHPYKVIMDMMLDFKIKNPNCRPIQTIGMTASPGVGKGKTRNEVLDNLITLLANLNVNMNPARVEENVKDLEKYQNTTEQNFVRVNIVPDRFTRKIHEAMLFLEDKLKKRDVFGPARSQTQSPPEEKDKQKYENWVVDLIRHAQLKIEDGELTRVVILFANHMKMYHNLLYLKRLIPFALEAVKHQAEFEQDGLEGRIVREIYQRLDKVSRNAEVPMLTKLFEILLKELVTNNAKEDSRCIIFVQRRMIAPALVNAILQNTSLSHLNPKSLTGSNEHADIGGMTKAEQESALKTFRDGKCKILIATSVAEEGLDIRECNLVIMYNYVTGEVGRIQRAGRGRAENSRSILLTACGSDHIEREKVNEICALATEVAIKDLKLLSNEQRNAKIQKVQEKQRKERLSLLTKKLMKLQEAAKWKILCGQCKKFITRAHKIRHINYQHRFVVDEDFYSVVERVPCVPHPIAPGTLMEEVATFYCGKRECRHYLGVEMQYKDKTYPSLTAKRLVFEDDLGNTTTSKQWSKCPFEVEKAVDDDQEEVDHEQLQEFVASQAESVAKGFISDDISLDEAKEAIDLMNINMKSSNRGFYVTI